jgi:hypothetical protein
MTILRPVVLCLMLATGVAAAVGQTPPGSIVQSSADSVDKSHLDPFERMLQRRGDEGARWTLHDSEQRLASLVNSLRSELGLPDLEVDARSSTTIRGRMKRCFGKLGEECRQSVWLARVDPYVADWDKGGFAATGTSELGLLKDLKRTPGFLDAVSREGATHLAVAVGEAEDGQGWCVVYVTRRLIWLDGLSIFATEGMCGSPGHRSAVYTGRSLYRQVAARVHRGPDIPVSYRGGDDGVEVEVGPDGSFEVSLSLPTTRGPECHVVFYVKSAEEQDYRIAACVVYPCPRRGSH